MDAQFVDRILTCMDCRGDFIFTAGEQLFFYDKQFKNDPKRCKRCKGRRSGLTSVANGTGPVAAGLSRTETRTECSDCGVQTTVPFKPTQGRPVLCRQCFQVKSKSVPVLTPLGVPDLRVPDPAIPDSQIPVPAIPDPGVSQVAATQGMGSQALLPAVAPAVVLMNPAIVDAVPALRSLTPPLTELADLATTSETVTALTAVSADRNGRVLSLEAAQLAVATMAAASPTSSVATMADLASILAVPEAPAAGRNGKAHGPIPGLVAAAQGEAVGRAAPLPVELPDIGD